MPEEKRSGQKQETAAGKAEEGEGKRKHGPSGQKHAEDGMRQEISELKDTLQRLQAEFENSRKRLEKEKRVFSDAANACLVRKLLPLLDSIGAAEIHLEQQQEAGKEDALKGIESIKRQLLAVLKAEGLEEIDALGKKFDPMLHECVMQGREQEREDQEILEEIQKGYLFNGNALRHSKVKVNKL